ncbi:YibE/F family protein [Xylanimonas cellulosilytica DSM 15894]|uniref:YibE/F family protein n=1 Tax=Xylanimonas cellulosilytica (strain DSM 15894 / JCM 12276 / CECT 5975 / KCTC 9989 / LMG 20990 / NBRC 107835 / XIL07) TaxID=446471 RepID=D1BRP4_XYLCX|nr:YibE/F family protein [Xylanimonas cellulosilytica]ACZ32310.1 YibE/F family protein [Xylanimonas cellulosilytica DSM 15894]
MGSGHSHGHAAPTPVEPRTRLILTILLAPALLVTIFGLFALWPDAAAVPDRAPVEFEDAHRVVVTVVGPRDDVTDTVPVRSGDTVTLMRAPDPSIELEPGDRVVAVGSPTDAEAGVPYWFFDFERETPLALLVGAFVLVVLLVARWRGLTALLGLGFAFLLFVHFTIPALLAAQNALAVALVTSSAVMFVVLYLAHGFTARTSSAMLGTLAGLAMTTGIGAWAVDAAGVTGANSTTEMWLPRIAPGVSLPEIALCGLVIAGMGVLNDVTITQASTVWELREAAPDASRGELFARGMRIGRDHIASTVYTMAYAYAGAALAVLMNLWLIDQPLLHALTSGQIAEEIVRTLVASIGLVLAIPATTAISVFVAPGPAGAAVTAPGSAAG